MGRSYSKGRVRRGHHDCLGPGQLAPVGDAEKGRKKGHLQFILSGKRLKGMWDLVRMTRRKGEKKDPWLSNAIHGQGFSNFVRRWRLALRTADEPYLNST